MNDHLVRRRGGSCREIDLLERHTGAFAIQRCGDGVAARDRGPGCIRSGGHHRRRAPGPRLLGGGPADRPL